MTAHYVLTFAAALVLALAGTPFLRRLAVRFDVVDHPAARKVHLTPTPYLGGVAIIVAALIGLAFSPDVSIRVLSIAAAAIGLGLIGGIDDKRTISPLPRLAAQVGAAAVAVLAGVRGHVTGYEIVDVAITLVWIVGITNALNLLDNMDGLAGGTAALAGTGIFIVAAHAGEHVVASTAAGLVGGCLGFLAYNKRPASIFMGDAGALFLGYCLAVLTIEVDPSLPRPHSFLVPLLVLALPLVDTTVVVVDRLLDHRPVMSGAKDHLSHRLTRHGFTRGAAVLFLAALEASAVGAAIAVAERSVAAALAGALASLLIAAWAVRPPGVATRQSPPAEKLLESIGADRT
jgi:UDP-GlcNAc:undecaprenyl-phosphate GlcNAc-1-phosphate transferase